MIYRRIAGLAIPLVALMLPMSARAQGGHGDVYWHIDPSVKSCSMVIDPSLTQAQWKTFSRQAGALLSDKSPGPAAPLGRRNFSVSLDYSVTPVDQHDPAWINTFTHPDADCPLGDQVKMPMLRASAGLTDRLDAGGFWTTAPGANYGLVGAELEYAFLDESATRPAVSAGASFVTLTGVPDFNFNVFSAGVTASKRIARFTPYAGVRGNLAVGTETTTKVDLRRETSLLPQGFVGAAYSVWNLGLAAEYNVAEVNTFAFAIGVHR